MPRGRWTAIAVASLVLASCAANPNVASRPENSGTTGSIGTNASAGSAVGGILGLAVGTGLDEKDRARAFAAEMQALEFGEPGSPIGWRSDAGAKRGTVVPGAHYEARGTRCRDISHTIYIDGRPQIARGTACRNTDGTWSPLG